MVENWETPSAYVWADPVWTVERCKPAVRFLTSQLTRQMHVISWFTASQQSALRIIRKQEIGGLNYIPIKRIISLLQAADVHSIWLISPGVSLFISFVLLQEVTSFVSLQEHFIGPSLIWMNQLFSIKRFVNREHLWPVSFVSITVVVSLPWGWWRPKAQFGLWCMALSRSFKLSTERWHHFRLIGCASNSGLHLPLLNWLVAQLLHCQAELIDSIFKE